MPKAKKNEKQIAMNLDPNPGPKNGTCMKYHIYQVLVQLHDLEGTDGRSVLEIAKAAKTTGLKATWNQVRNTLNNLAFDNHAIVKTITGRRRFFLGPVPYQPREHRQKNITGTVLRALKTLYAKNRKGRNPNGYTNAEIYEFLKTSGVDLTKGQVSNATSRCQLKGLIGATSTSGHKGRRTDRFRWTLNPEAEAMIVQAFGGIKPKRGSWTIATLNAKPLVVEEHTPPTDIVEQPAMLSPSTLPTQKARKATTSLARQLRKLHDQAKHLIGKGLVSREVPPSARVEAFAVIDAFDALLGRL